MAPGLMHTVRTRISTLRAGAVQTAANDSTTDLVDSTGLDGVPVTALWTLWSRAAESERTDSTFRDPLAEQVYRSISFPYQQFGRPSQAQALRAATFDAGLRSLLHDAPDATVVALGDGLQTTYWRLKCPDVPWFSVDLPEMIALRERLLPPAEQLRAVAMSALDRSWFDLVETEQVIITAEGLLMYLPPEEVYTLLADLAQRFPGGRLLFDGIPPWFAERTAKGVSLARGASYRLPHMPFGLTIAEARRLPEVIPGVESWTELPWVPGRGLWFSPAVQRVHRRFGNHRHFVAELAFAR